MYIYDYTTIITYIFIRSNRKNMQINSDHKNDEKNVCNFFPGNIIYRSYIKYKYIRTEYLYIYRMNEGINRNFPAYITRVLLT